MNILRQLRWKLTLSYTLVTVCAFLVVLLIMGGIVLPQIFLPDNAFNPSDLVEILRRDTIPLWSQLMSQSPVDTTLIRILLENSEGTLTNREFLRIGSMQFSVRTMVGLQVLIIGSDGTFLGSSALLYPNSVVGEPFDVHQIQGLEGPLKAALAGEKDVNRLYSVYERTNRILLAIPVLNNNPQQADQVVGAVVAILEPLPTRADIPAHMVKIAGRSLIFFFLGAGLMGALFGTLFSHGLVTRFKRISATIDQWSEGDFSGYIEDDTGDEITQISQRLNNMAKQLQNLLRRRQEMAISEERNRLARDLHDSAKQQALAASFELGTTLTLYERDPGSARKHLVEADNLVDGVRKELTNLVHELRPVSVIGQDFSETLKEYALDWSQRNGISLNINQEGNGELSLETRETLFRIAQEALANTARHSASKHADLSLEFMTDTVMLTIHDDGHGFATDVQHNGLGLYSMRERAEALGGSFQVNSAPGQGTQIVVTLPRGNDEDAP